MKGFENAEIKLVNLAADVITASPDFIEDGGED